MSHDGYHHDGVNPFKILGVEHYLEQLKLDDRGSGFSYPVRQLQEEGVESRQRDDKATISIFLTFVYRFPR